MASEVEQLRAELTRVSERLERMETEAAIRALATRYARGADRHDEELLAAVFWPDAQVNYGRYSGLRDPFIEWANANHARSFAIHEHHVTNQTLEITGDTAHLESYVIYFLRSLDDAFTLIGGGRYIDRVERREGAWRIAVREYLPDIKIRAGSMFAGAFADQWLPESGPGRYDKDDLSYRRPLPARVG